VLGVGGRCGGGCTWLIYWGWEWGWLVVGLGLMGTWGNDMWVGVGFGGRWGIWWVGRGRWVWGDSGYGFVGIVGELERVSWSNNQVGGFGGDGALWEVVGLVLWVSYYLWGGSVEYWRYLVAGGR
jgi:hypothetical protein